SGIRPFVLGDISDNSVTSGGPEAERALRDSPGGPEGAGVVNRSGFLGLKYDVSDSLSVFGQALVGRTESSNRGEHSSFSMGPPSYGLTIFRENPYIPADVAAIMDEYGLDSFVLNK